jgi:hypothetical protein
MQTVLSHEPVATCSAKQAIHEDEPTKETEQRRALQRSELGKGSKPNLEAETMKRESVSNHALFLHDMSSTAEGGRWNVNDRPACNSAGW